MGITKTADYPQTQLRVARLAKALGHPARIAIVEHLLDAESCICGELVDQLPLAQPTVSRHLKELKEAGLIIGAIEGNSICYCLNRSALDELTGYLQAISERSGRIPIEECRP